MKHTLKITLVLLGMFFLTQLIGLFVIDKYSPQTIQVTQPDGNITNFTSYNLPYGMDPPREVEQKSVGSIATSFAIIFAIAIAIMLLLMKFNADFIIRTWFFIVVALAVGIALNSAIISVPYSSLIALAISLPLTFFKIVKRNIIVHNITELMIYPGIAAIFVALVLSLTSSPKNSVLAVSIILILISLYDMYAVWHSGFMQRMAQYQIKNLKLFTGFFIPYLGKKQKELLAKMRSAKSNKLKNKKFKVSVAILGGGDVVFPIIFAGVVFNAFGLLSALIISLGASLALLSLFWFSEKGKFYPAMPFISAGCFIALGVIYLIN